MSGMSSTSALGFLSPSLSPSLSLSPSPSLSLYDPLCIFTYIHAYTHTYIYTLSLGSPSKLFHCSTPRRHCFCLGFGPLCFCKPHGFPHSYVSWVHAWARAFASMTIWAFTNRGSWRLAMTASLVWHVCPHIRWSLGRHEAHARGMHMECS